MRYKAAHVTQDDGSLCWRTNCGMAVGAWAADGASGGAKTPEPTYFRFVAGAGGDDCRPTGLGDVMHGLMRMGLWHRCKLLYDLTPAEFRTLITRRDGRHIVVPTDFEKWPDRKCQPGYEGYHMVGIVAGNGTGSRRGTVLAMNPLCKAYTWVDTPQVIAAALEYSIEHGDGRTVDCIVVTPPKA